MSSRTKQIGLIGEQVITTEFVKRNITTLIPVGDNEPYDLVININDKFLRIQVKTTEFVKDGVMKFCTNITNPHKKTSRKYKNNEIDLFGLYCIENGYVGLLRVEECTAKETIIRLQKPKTNQQMHIKMAEEYEFDRQLQQLYLSL